MTIYKRNPWAERADVSEMEPGRFLVTIPPLAMELILGAASYSLVGTPPEELHAAALSYLIRENIEWSIHQFERKDGLLDIPAFEY